MPIENVPLDAETEKRLEDKRRLFMPPVQSAATPPNQPPNPEAPDKMPDPPGYNKAIEDKINQLRVNLGVGGSRAGSEHDPPATIADGTAPLARGGDMIAPNLRSAITPDYNNYDYANTLPLARNRNTGKIELAIPHGAYDFANGVLDLLEGPTTGTVSPAGTNALVTAAIAGSKSPFPSTPRYAGAVPPGFKPATAATGTMSAIPPYVPPPSAFTTALSNRLSTALGHLAGMGVGAYVGGETGGLIGYPAGDAVRMLVAKYGPMVTSKMLAQSGVTQPWNLIRNYAVTEPQNQYQKPPTSEGAVLPFGGPGQQPAPPMNVNPGSPMTPPSPPTGNQVLLPQYWPSA